jgi:hypothetical protein
MLDPAYVFLYSHPVGTDIALLSSRAPIVLGGLGAEYATYLTGIAPGRIYCQALIEELVAMGLTLIVTVLYPGATGLGHAERPTIGSQVSDIVYVFGGDP